MEPSTVRPGRQQFCIEWEPTPKGRPRFAVRHYGGRTVVSTRTPEKTAIAESAIRWSLTAQKARLYARDVPLRVSAIFMLRRPPSAPRTRLWPVTKPDGDNLWKLVGDAGNGHLWEDQQLVIIQIEKRYCPEGVAPHILLDVEPLLA